MTAIRMAQTLRRTMSSATAMAGDGPSRGARCIPAVTRPRRSPVASGIRTGRCLGSSWRRGTGQGPVDGDAALLGQLVQSWQLVRKYSSRGPRRQLPKTRPSRR